MSDMKAGPEDFAGKRNLSVSELQDGSGMSALQLDTPYAIGDGELGGLLHDLLDDCSPMEWLPEKLSSFPNLHLEDLLYSSGSLIVGLRWPDARWSPCSLFALSALNVCHCLQTYKAPLVSQSHFSWYFLINSSYRNRDCCSSASA